MDIIAYHVYKWNPIVLNMHNVSALISWSEKLIVLNL